MSTVQQRPTPTDNKPKPPNRAKAARSFANRLKMMKVNLGRDVIGSVERMREDVGLLPEDEGLRAGFLDLVGKFTAQVDAMNEQIDELAGAFGRAEKAAKRTPKKLSD